MSIVESTDPQVNACCREDANLKEIERRPVLNADGSDAGPLVIYQCQVCQRKHYVHEIKPFHIGLAGKSVG